MRPLKVASSRAQPVDPKSHECRLRPNEAQCSLLVSRFLAAQGQVFHVVASIHPSLATTVLYQMIFARHALHFQNILSVRRVAQYLLYNAVLYSSANLIAIQLGVH